MEGRFRSKTSKIVLTVFIGFIVVSFMFTGYERMMGTPDTVAMVDDLEVSADEYRRAYNRQLETYRRMYGGDLSTEQIENFNVRENAVNTLVQRMLMVKLGNRVGVSPSADEVRKEIKSLPYFKTNDQFDLNKYKSLLSSNGYSPSEFEEQIKHDVTAQKTSTLLESLPLSESYFEEKKEFASMGLKVTMVQLQKSKLKGQVEVTPKERKEFLAKDENLSRVKEMFENRKSQLDRPEQVRARHILFRTQGKDKGQSEKEALQKAKQVRENLTPENFARMAKKHTEEPGGKQKGGDLGWFGKGRMVPAFEEVAFNSKTGTISEPVKSRFGYHLIHVRDKRAAKEAKFEDHKAQLANELIREQSQEELETLMAEIKTQANKALKNDHFAKLQQLQKDYGIQLDRQKTLTLLSSGETSIFLKPEQVNQLFQEKGKFYTFSGDERHTLVKVHGKADVEPPKEKVAKQSRKSLEQTLSKKLQQSAIEAMRDRVSVKVFSNRLR